MTRPYLICCDFDGVLHSYKSGWQGPDVIPDPPVPGAMNWLVTMLHDDRFEIAIYSSRSSSDGGIEAMRRWLASSLLNDLCSHNWSVEEATLMTNWVLDRLSFPRQKPPASMTIDDRAFHFCGEFPTAEWLLSFQPWYKAKLGSDRRYSRPTPRRLEEIAQALADTPYGERDPADHAIGELLEEINHLRGGNR